jgi:hypothetical protein
MTYLIAAALTVGIAHSDHVKWCADDWALVIAIRHRPLPAPGRLLERGVLPVGLGSQCEMYVRIGHIRSNTVYDPGDGISICETDIWASPTAESLTAWCVAHADRRLRRSDVAQRPRRLVNAARQCSGCRLHRHALQSVATHMSGLPSGLNGWI